MTDWHMQQEFISNSSKQTREIVSFLFLSLQGTERYIEQVAM